MIEVALLLGLGAVGYLLAVEDKSKAQPSSGLVENFTPRPTQSLDDGMEPDMTNKGHNNEVPYFGANRTQSMYSGATNGILDSHTCLLYTSPSPRD